MRISGAKDARAAVSRWAGLCLCSLVPAIVAGCTKEEPATPISGGSGKTATVQSAAPTSGAARKKIVFVFKVGGIAYSEACKTGAEQASRDPAINSDVEYEASARGTAEKQVDIIHQAIAGKADAIVIAPVNAASIAPAIDEATAQGIKVFTWDDDAPASKRLFYCAAADDMQIGSDIMDALAKSIGGKGKVLFFSGRRTAENLNRRLQGFKNALSKYPGIEVVQPYVYNDDMRDKAATMAAQALLAHPDVVGIACTNFPSPPAAGEAILNSRLNGKVKVWGLALPSQTRPYLLHGSVTGLYLWDPRKLTYLTAKLVRAALDGKMPRDGDSIGAEGKIGVKNGVVTLPLQIEITRTNVDQFRF